MKRRVFLESLLKKSGRFTDEQIKEFFDKPDEDYADAEATAALAELMTADEALGNDTVFGKAKGKAKAEALDPIDTMLKGYEPKLTAAQKTEYDKLGKDSHKKYQFMLKTFDELGSKTGDANYDDLKAEYDGLKGRLTTDYVAKTEFDAINGKLTSAQKTALNSRILTAAIRSPKLRDVTKDRHFERNFVADVEALLSNGFGEKKVKGVIDPETGKVMRADQPDQPLLVDGAAVDLNRLADLTIGGFDWAKSSDPPPVSQVRVEGDGKGQTGLTAAQRSMLERESADE